MNVDKIISDIKNLKIQGATNVALAAVDVFQYKCQTSKALGKKQFINELNSIRKKLFATRPTEPMMRNAIRFAMHINYEKYELTDLKDLIVSRCEEFRRMELSGRKRIIEIGSKRIEDEMTIMIHCHSSTVFNIVNVAKKKNIKVICTETRPRFQGRITAKELIAAGIPTTMIIDSAARHYVNDVDMVLVGADVINNDGSIINKIGSSTIALCADEANTDFYCASTIMKFNPETVFGPAEEIELRATSEIWKNPPKGLKIVNPAFDMVPREYIEGIITEEGIFAPETIYDIVRRDYNWIFGGF